MKAVEAIFFLGLIAAVLFWVAVWIINKILPKLSLMRRPYEIQRLTHSDSVEVVIVDRTTGHQIYSAGTIPQRLDVVDFRIGYEQLIDDAKEEIKILSK